MSKDERLHERFADHTLIRLPSERNFGFTVGGILTAIAAARWFWAGVETTGNLIIAATGATLLMLAAVAPSSLKLANKLWGELGLLLARVVNPIVMLLIFAVVFMPFALIMRIAGKDALRLRSGRRGSSMWTNRVPPGPSPESAINQF